MILYSKHNPKRKEKFQLITTIEEFQNGIISCKSSNIESSKKFLDSFFDKYKYLKNNNFPVAPLEPFGINKNKIGFKYIEGGETLDCFLFRCFVKKDKNGFIKTIVDFVNLLKFNNVEDKILESSFIDIFGGKKNEKYQCFKSGCIDLSFDNIIVENFYKNKLKLIDYEWTFEFSVPFKYVVFRIITSFYFKYIEYDLNKTFIPISYFYNIFQISKEDRAQCVVFEYNFQKYVYSKSDFSLSELSDNYSKIEGDYTHGDYKSAKELHVEKQEYINKIESLGLSLKKFEISLDKLQKELISKEEEIRLIKNSTSWKITKPIRLAGNCFLIIKKLIKKSFLIIKKEGIIIFLKKTIKFIKRKSLIFIYIYIKNKARVTENTFDLNVIKKIKPDSLKIIKFKEELKPKVSIIIPVFNKWEYTYNCLQSLKKNIKELSYEIIIIDDNSSDFTGKMVGYAKNIRYHKNTSNVGFVKSCNTGANMAIGQFLVFLNNDTYIKEGWLEELIKTIESKEDVGLVGSKLIYPNGLLQEAGGIVWEDGSASNYGRACNPNSYEFNYAKEVDYCSGASIALRKDVFSSVGGFDELFAPGYYEDTDLCFKIREIGLKVIYQPFSQLFHFEGVSAGTDLGSGMKKYQEINKAKFFKKWESVLKSNNISYSEDRIFLARDKSNNKKIILYVDNCVPLHDKDAGSFIAYQYVKILLNLGYKIIFWPNGFHLLNKTEPYTEELQRMGVEVVYGNQNFKSFINKNGSFVDYAILSRPDIAKNYIDILKETTNINILYMGHDLHYLREERELRLTGSPSSVSSLSEIKETELSVIEKSKVSMFFSEAETSILNDIFKKANIEKIPWIQEIENAEPQEFKKRKDIIFIGGYGHKPNVDAVLWLHDKIFPRLKKKIPDINIFCYGSNPPREIVKLNKEGFYIRGFVEEKDVKSVFDEAKIFIAPLRFGAGFKGKIAKAMSNGIPVVTTEIGSEGIGLEDGVNVVIGNNEKEIVEAIEKLYYNETFWNKISKNSLAHIKNNFSTQVAKNKIMDIFNKVDNNFY